MRKVSYKSILAQNYCQIGLKTWRATYFWVETEYLIFEIKILFGQSEMDLKGKVSYPLIFPKDYFSYSNTIRRILFNR